MMSDLTIGIKTGERPRCLETLLRSIRGHYPDIAVQVADDSAEPTLFPGAEWIRLDVDAGLSVGRNALLEECRTPYIALMDDDFEVTTETQLERLLPFVRSGSFDLMAGAVRQEGEVLHYEGRICIEDDWIVLENLPDDGPCRVEISFNFFVDDVAAVRQMGGWDPQFKIGGEHQDFFLRAKEAGVRVGYLAHCVVDHHRSPAYSPRYFQLRERWEEGRRALYRKWNVQGVRGTLHRV